MHVLTPRVGAYAEYVGGTDVGVLKIPDYMSFEEAATLGTGIGTAGLALFHSLKIPGWPTKPASEAQTVLVWGGSTATGTLVIQLLKLSASHTSPFCRSRSFRGNHQQINLLAVPACVS